MATEMAVTQKKVSLLRFYAGALGHVSIDMMSVVGDKRNHIIMDVASLPALIHDLQAAYDRTVADFGKERLSFACDCASDDGKHWLDCAIFKKVG